MAQMLRIPCLCGGMRVLWISSQFLSLESFHASTCFSKFQGRQHEPIKNGHEFSGQTL